MREASGNTKVSIVTKLEQPGDTSLDLPPQLGRGISGLP